MASYYNEHTVLWLNGEFVKASEAKMDLYSQSLHYGYSVFEGIRSYKNIHGETKIFKAQEHYQRLAESARLMNMPYKWTADELIAANYEVLKRNNIQDAYIRPLVYAPANMSFARNTELLRIKTSSYQRPNPKGFNIQAKAGGHYVNSILASQEARSTGYDEALLTDMNGFIAEGPGANIFFEKSGTLFTPALGNILPGITRATVLELCKELDIAVEEGQYTPAQLKNADTAFFCGTAAEVIGWESIDETKFPKDWNESISKQIQTAYKERVTEKEIKKPKVKSKNSLASA